MRTFSLAAVAALAACSSGKDAAKGAPIDCALDSSADFARDCTLEATAGDKGALLVVHRPDGGFRRLVVVQGGASVAAADGAEEAAVTPVKGSGNDGGLEVRLGADRYRLPLPLPSADAARR